MMWWEPKTRCCSMSGLSPSLFLCSCASVSPSASNFFFPNVEIIIFIIHFRVSHLETFLFWVADPFGYNGTKAAYVTGFLLTAQLPSTSTLYTVILFHW